MRRISSRVVALRLAAGVGLVGGTLLRAADVPAGAPPAGVALTWSNTDMETTPNGKVQFHGQFNKETVLASTASLGARDFVEISMDLLIIRSWDGSVPMFPDAKPQPAGPDYVRLAVRGGPTLLYATFSNRPDFPGFNTNAMYQNYPSPVPGDRFAPQAGAKEFSTLGYDFPDPGPPQVFPEDATYHLKFVIPYTENALTLEMSGINLQHVTDEGWGVTNVVVRPVSADALRKPDEEEIAAAFRDALNVTGTNQPEAFNVLILGMDQTVAWVAKNVTPQPIDAKALADQLKNLGVDDSQVPVRERAYALLSKMGPQIEPALREARKTAPADLRLRIDWLLEGIGVKPITDEDVRRVMVATRVLEIIGTPRAREVSKLLTDK